MITAPAGVRAYLAMGPTDMRKGIDSLSMLVQELLKLEPALTRRQRSHTSLRIS